MRRRIAFLCQLYCPAQVKTTWPLKSSKCTEALQHAVNCSGRDYSERSTVICLSNRGPQRGTRSKDSAPKAPQSKKPPFRAALCSFGLADPVRPLPRLSLWTRPSGPVSWCTAGKCRIGLPRCQPSDPVFFHRSLCSFASPSFRT